MHQLLLDDSSSRLCPRSSKSSLSPVIPQLMRKDKEIASLHEEVTQLNQKIVMLESQIKKQDQSVEVQNLQDKLKKKIRKIKELKNQLKQQQSESYQLQQDQQSFQFHQPIVQSSRIKGQIIQSIIPQKKKESPQKKPQEVVIIKQKDDPVCLEYYQNLLRQSQDRELQLSTMLESLVTKVNIIQFMEFFLQIVQFNSKILTNNQNISEKLRENQEHFLGLVVETYDKQLYFKEKYEIFLELFQKQKEIQTDYPQLSFIKPYFKNQDSYHEEFQGLCDTVDTISNSIKLSNFDNQIQFQLMEERKKTEQSEKSKQKLIEKIEELLNLSLEKQNGQEDILERIRNLIQMQNRQTLELKQCQGQLTVALEEKKQLIKVLSDQKQHFNKQMEEQLNANRRSNEEAQEIIRKMQEEQRYRSSQHKQSIQNNEEELVNYYQNLLEDNQKEVQFLLSKHNTQVQMEKQKLIDEFNEKYEQLLNDLNNNRHSELEEQEQKYLKVFDSLKDEIKIKEKQYEQLWKDYQLVCNKESEMDNTHKKSRTQSQLLNSTMITADKENQSFLLNQSPSNYYKKKCKNLLNKKVKELERVLFYIEDIANKKQQLLVDEDLLSIFNKNPELEKLVNRIYNAINRLVEDYQDSIYELCKNRKRLINQVQYEVGEQYGEQIEPKIIQDLEKIEMIGQMIKDGKDIRKQKWVELLSRNEQAMVLSLIQLRREDTYNMSRSIYDDSIFGQNWGQELQKILKRQWNEKLRVEQSEKEKYNTVLEIIKSNKEILQDATDLLSIFMESLNFFERRELIEDIKSRILVQIQKMNKSHKISRLGGELINDLLCLFGKIKTKG